MPLTDEIEQEQISEVIEIQTYLKGLDIHSIEFPDTYAIALPRPQYGHLPAYLLIALPDVNKTRHERDVPFSIIIDNDVDSVKFYNSPHDPFIIKHYRAPFNVENRDIIDFNLASINGMRWEEIGFNSFSSEKMEEMGASNPIQYASNYMCDFDMKYFSLSSKYYFTISNDIDLKL